MTLPTLNLGPDLEATLASGHPWVYRNRLPRHNLQTGQWLRLEAGRSSAVGLYDDEGQIAVRLFHPDRVPDDGLLKARAVEALALRAGLEAKENDAYRLINGEGDGLPGIVIDRYGRFAVVKTVASSVEQLAPTLAAAVAKAGRLRGVMHRHSEGHEILWGAPPPPEITVQENGLRFIANVHEGQKTGLFLDQRDNRQTVREQALGRRVLNLFSYSGAFGVYALAGGAEHVTDVDQAAPALRDAERNVAANDLGLHRHETVQADAHAFLRDQVATGRRYDLVILDPPSLARGRRHRYAALRAYRRLNTLAFKVLTPGGLLATASCTAQVSPEAFREVLAEAAREAGRQAQIVHEAAHASDHPVPLHFPEQEYLASYRRRPGQVEHPVRGKKCRSVRHFSSFIVPHTSTNPTLVQAYLPESRPCIRFKAPQSKGPSGTGIREKGDKDRGSLLLTRDQTRHRRKPKNTVKSC